MIDIHVTGVPGDQGIELRLAGTENAPLLALERPIGLETFDGDPGDWSGRRANIGYAELRQIPSGVVGTAQIRTAAGEFKVVDRWEVDQHGVTLDRTLHCSGADERFGVRALVDAQVVAAGFDSDAQVFAPPALYNLNDIDGDGIEDYLDTRELVYRDDRLTGLAVLAYSPTQSLGIALSREDIPQHDDIPDRVGGQVGFIQTTDVGSLGFVPDGDSWRLAAAYPFVERDRSHALTAAAREPWGAFWPVVDGEVFHVSHRFAAVRGATAIDALWELWQQRAAHLSPRRVDLTTSLEQLSELRLAALLPYYRESATAAGFVTNCHPQDGMQLGDVLQYGFTGQAVLNALHVINHADQLADSDAREKGLRTIESFVRRASTSPFGLVHTLHDFDSNRDASWWSGLLLPLAYADADADLHDLMGPVYDHMKPTIEALSEAADGTYLRCLAEEHHALLRAYRAEIEHGIEHPEWLTVARAFGEFLLNVQEPDGAWRRAYTFDGDPIIEPRTWFGRVDLNQRSSTATAVPFLHELYELTHDRRMKDAATRAARFVAEHFVRRLAFNGGIHDSIYARAQLVDSESILFALRACLAGWVLTRDDDLATAAVDAARILATWVYLWDVPLPPASTLGKRGFRSTGWSACDTAGAGYIHPYELHAVPDLMEAALIGHDKLLASVADLVLHGSNETVATVVESWGYARPGLQEEGLLVSWWLIDDPMFAGTSFGGRGKGEGNKTCLPWISAIGIDATDAVLGRYGTTDLLAHWSLHAPAAAR